MSADEFKAIRALSTFTQMELADKLGVHWRTVQRWEAGDRRVSGPVEKLMRQIEAAARGKK